MNDLSPARCDVCRSVQVFPGETYVYKWKVTVPENQASPCFSSLYYSSHSYPKDLYSGLVGPLVICKKGVLNEQGNSKIAGKGTQSAKGLSFVVVKYTLQCFFSVLCCC